MKKSKLELKPHILISGQNTVEVWHENTLVATVTGADGPGVRVISKYPMDVIRGGMGEMPNVIEVRVESGG